jgi:hypothetical protein
MSKADYLDGFLEGHETSGTRGLYRFGVISFVILSLFCGIANIAIQGTKGHRVSDAFVSVAILGLLAYTLQHIKWYRQDNADPKHRRATIYLMFTVLLLDVASCIAFHDTISYQPPAPEMPPTTVAPTVAPTPAPTTAPTPSGPTPAPTPTPTNATKLMELFLEAKAMHENK